VREDGRFDSSCCAPLKLGPDCGVPNAHCAASSNQGTVERRAVTDVHINVPQGRGPIWNIGNVRHVEYAGRFRCDSVSDCRRQDRVLDRPRFDEQAGERELAPG
jgi:hypothetical protein